MTLWLSISSILSNIFNIFVNLFPTPIAFFRKNIGYSHGNTTQMSTMRLLKVHAKAYQTIIEPTVHQHHHPQSIRLQHDWPLSLACLKRLKLWHGTKHSLSIKAHEKFLFGNLIAKMIQLPILTLPALLL